MEVPDFKQWLRALHKKKSSKSKDSEVFLGVQ